MHFYMITSGWDLLYIIPGIVIIMLLLTYPGKK